MIDPRVFRLVSYGLYVVASFRDSRLNGQIANTVFQLTADPPLMAVSLNCQNFTHELVAESRRFSISVLSQETPLKFIGLFGFKCGRQVDKYSGIAHTVLPSGTPVIRDYCLGFFDLEVRQSIALGTHTLFIGEVMASELLASGLPMTYAYYHEIKGGRTQANAPTYIKDNDK
jgi:flavin reductase (DIM6/NTAB) family NADH-FMN oxidoreductase RutF